MNAMMMQQPLLISTLLTHAERNHGDQEIVSRRVEGDLHRQTYGDLAQRSRRMANALAAKGVGFGDRVATFDTPEDVARQTPDPTIESLAAMLQT